ncbi:MAG: SGNH/GDSL hydrolase family protein [Microthrixaceae bacterium]|nr:SGNH/GDSL hydrolase family protein [Microthrixaceae bacterium]
MGALAAAVLLAARGALWVALTLAVAVLALVQARTVSPRFRARFEATLTRVAAAIGRAVGTALSWALLSLVFVAVIVPVWVLTVPFHRRRFGRPRGVRGDGWIARRRRRRPGPSRLRPRAGFADGAAPPTARHEADRASGDGPEATPDRRPTARRRRPVLVGLGVVALLVLADLTLGIALAASGIREGTRGDTRRFVEDAVTTTLSAPPIADEPWVDDYREALIDYELDGGSYTPFLVRAPRPFESEWLNTTDEERRSYEPESTTTPPLRVAFFGGSTMFGVGQRDEHTIPSEVARLAEDDGVALEVHNYGLPGWVAWQEVQYLERLLARGERYDLAVFYDGFNELLVQGTGYSADPTHLGADVMDRFARDFHDEHEQEPAPTAGLADLVATYRRSSGVARLLGLTGEEATSSQGGIARATATPDEQAAAALDIYGRATRLADALTTDEATPVRFFWQPSKAGWPDALLDRLPAGVTDLSHVLDGRQDDLYIDEVHTNEEGARLVAEAIWAEIGPGLEAAAGEG